MANATQQNNPRFYPWLIWALGAAFFFSEYFARVAPSVMVPQLMQSFHVKALALGSLSAFFYWTYVLMQIPVGGLVDRYGTHKLLTVSAGLCALSCFMFAFSHTLFIAELGRLFLGFGASFAFVGALKLATVWFPASRFGLLAGLTQALGMLGAAVGEGPISVSVAVIGWRPTMLFMGIALAILAVLIGVVVKDPPTTHPTHSNNVKTAEIIRGLKIIFRNSQTWWNGLYVGLLYAPTAAFAELWGVSYLVRTYNLHEETAATAVSLIFIGWGLGGPLIGWMSDRMRKRRPLMLWSAIASLATMGIVLYAAHLPTSVLFVLLFLYGVANTGVATGYAVSAEINPRPVTGISIAFSNMASVIVGAAFQPIIGAILDAYWDGKMVNGIPFYSAHAFRVAMLTLPICLFFAIITTFKVRETHCRVYEELQ